jgi:hypothetical protein
VSLLPGTQRRVKRKTALHCLRQPAPDRVLRPSREELAKPATPTFALTCDPDHADFSSQEEAQAEYGCDPNGLSAHYEGEVRADFCDGSARATSTGAGTATGVPATVSCGRVARGTDPSRSCRGSVSRGSTRGCTEAVAEHPGPGSGACPWPLGHGADGGLAVDIQRTGRA